MTTEKGRGEVEFRFIRPDANHVFLVGDFNDWSQQSHPMTQTASGDWVTHVELANGIHQFRYLADGQWYTDYAAFGVESCGGGYNSVIVMDEPAHPSVYVG